MPGSGGSYQLRLDQKVELHLRKSTNASNGIYRCDIGTQAMRVDINGHRESVYVGLYQHDTEGA